MICSSWFQKLPISANNLLCVGLQNYLYFINMRFSCNSNLINVWLAELSSFLSTSSEYLKKHISKQTNHKNELKRFIPDNKDLQILLPCLSGEKLHSLMPRKLQQFSWSIIAHEVQHLSSPQTTVLLQLGPISSIEKEKEWERK